MSRQHARSRGFTLVELLVVIGIIAILVAMLLPTLAKARNQARATACVANMSQCGAGFHAYAITYQGTLPQQLNNVIPLTDHDSWVWKMLPWVNNSYASMTCPNSMDLEGLDPGPGNPVMTYLYSAWASGRYEPNNQPRRISQSRHPESDLILIDHGPVYDQSWCIDQPEGGYLNGWPWWYPHYRYSVTAAGEYHTALFMDGHAEMVLRGSLRQEQLTWQ